MSKPLALVILCLCLAAGSAAAGPRHPCITAGADVVELDGMLDDWDGVEDKFVGDRSDAGFRLRCLNDGTALYLAFDVSDEYVVRNGKTPAGEDRLEVSIDAGKAPLVLTVYPGKDKAAPRRLLGGKKLPAWLAVEDTLQPKGWSAEIKLPLARIAGWGPGTPILTYAVRYFDADVARTALTEHTVEWSGSFVLHSAETLYAKLIAELRINASQIKLDTQADLDPTRPGPERVIAGGTAVALLTDTYGFVQLPVAKPADVLKVELVDLAGDARRHVAVRLRQRGGGGTREVLMLYGARNGKLEEVHAIEIGKEQGGKRLTSTWAVESARAWKQAKGARRVLVVRAQPAVGWDEDTYSEAPSPDADPIHVPWDDDRTGAVYWLTKDGTLASAVLKR